MTLGKGEGRRVGCPSGEGRGGLQGSWDWKGREVYGKSRVVGEEGSERKNSFLQHKNHIWPSLQRSQSGTHHDGNAIRFHRHNWVGTKYRKIENFISCESLRRDMEKGTQYTTFLREDSGRRGDQLSNVR